MPSNMIRTARTDKPDADMERIRKVVLELQRGFEEAPLDNLNWIAFKSGRKKIRKRAAWRLALWHLFNDVSDEAAQALTYLNMLDNYLPRRGAPHWPAILKSEALLRLGRWEEARRCSFQAFEKFGGQDLMLACANLFAYRDGCPLSDEMRDRLRLDWINRALLDAGLEELRIVDPAKGLNLDNIAGPDNLPDSDSGRALVSVIVAAYNAEELIGTTLRSLQAQTWRNMEILVVDDASTDGTASVVEDFARRDPRIRLIRSETNRGDCYAINLAMAEAEGDFITHLDADDFAHPRKIETQAEALISHPDVIANRSRFMRAKVNLVMMNNYWSPMLMTDDSSTMFRREKVLKGIGYRDEVRGQGDLEYFHRIKLVFGEENFVVLPTGLLGLSRQWVGSYTGGHTGPGRRGFLFGMRREYLEAFADWHGRNANYYVPFPLKKRPYAMPRILDPRYGSGVEHYNVVYAYDARFKGGDTDRLVREIKSQAESGAKVGFMRLDWHKLGPEMPIARQFRDMLNADYATIIAYPEEANADLVILPFPPAIEVWRRWTPRIHTDKVAIICGRNCVRGSVNNGELLFDVKAVDRRVVEQFGIRGEWYPVGPVARRALEAENADIIISPDDWRLW